MTVTLPEKNLPIDFITLLKRNAHDTAIFEEKVKNVILENSNLKNLVLRTFGEFDAQKRAGTILRTLGWKNFRDRLCSVYLYKQQNGFFPHSTDVNLVKDVVEIESLLYPYAVNGFSRSFVLGLYLKMNSIKHLNKSLIVEMTDLLKMMKVKVVKIDWVIMILIQLLNFIDKKDIKVYLSDSNYKYQKIFNLLKAEEKELYVSNLLSYAYSINDFDTVVPSYV